MGTQHLGQGEKEREILDFSVISESLKLSQITSLLKERGKTVPNSYLLIALPSPITRLTDVNRLISQDGSNQHNPVQNSIWEERRCLPQLLDHQDKAVQARGTG